VKYPKGVWRTPIEKARTMAELQYTVTGMTCGHCEASVRREVSKLPGVADVQVSAAAGTLRVVSEADLADDDVLAAVDEAGYSAVRA
jgi:copper chaperone